MKPAKTPLYVLLAVFALGILLLPAMAFAQQEFGDEEAAAAACGCGVVGMIVSLVILVVWILIVVWVWKDANARGMDNPILWVIIVLLTGLIGLIIYLVVRPK